MTVRRYDCCLVSGLSGMVERPNGAWVYYTDLAVCEKERAGWLGTLDKSEHEGMRWKDRAEKAEASVKVLERAIESWKIEERDWANRWKCKACGRTWNATEYEAAKLHCEVEIEYGETSHWVGNQSSPDGIWCGPVELAKEETP